MSSFTLASLLDPGEFDVTEKRLHAGAIDQFKHCIGVAASYLHIYGKDIFSNPEVFPKLKEALPEGDLYRHMLNVLQAIHRNKEDILNIYHINSDLAKNNTLINMDGYFRPDGLVSTQIFVYKDQNAADVAYRMLLTQVGDNVLLEILSEKEDSNQMAQLIF